jgi:hypothetical protein
VFFLFLLNVGDIHYLYVKINFLLFFLNLDGETDNTKFNVTYYNNYIILTNKHTSETYVLYCTATQPIVTATNVTNYIQVPVTNVVVSDRSFISFLEVDYFPFLFFLVKKKKKKIN